MLTGQQRWARSRRFLFVQAMSEEQLKAAAAEASAQVEDGVEEISEEDLAGVAGGVANFVGISGAVGCPSYSDNVPGLT